MAVGNGLTVTVVLLTSLQPLALVTVTVYVPAEVTLIAAVVADVDHKYPVPPEAASVTDPPKQNVVGPPGVIMAAGSGLTVTVVISVSVQPLALVTVMVYVPVEVTLIAAVVADVDHK